MRVEREEHKMWTLWEQVKDEMLGRAKVDPVLQRLKQETGIDYPAPVMGKWHYFYYSDDGKKKISLVELLDAYSPWKKGSQWEICSGGTCSNCADAEERFDSKEEAEIRIKELFDE